MVKMPVFWDSLPHYHENKNLIISFLFIKISYLDWNQCRIFFSFMDMFVSMDGKTKNLSYFISINWSKSFSKMNKDIWFPKFNKVIFPHFCNLSTEGLQCHCFEILWYPPFCKSTHLSYLCSCPTPSRDNFQTNLELTFPCSKQKIKSKNRYFPP